MKQYITLVSIIFLIVNQSFAQKNKQYKVGIIGFYNFENLFDTVDDEKINDEEFLPEGGRQWTSEKYKEKLKNLAKVVVDVGTDMSPDGLALLGVSEIENKKVLEDFVKEKAIKSRNYQIVHYDSPDKRGIDCALLYNPKYFKVLDSKAMPVLLYDSDGDRKFTRDILYVKGIFDTDTIHVFVNHWPSRSGGEKRSQPFRNAAAKVCKDTINVIMKKNPMSKVFVMGDLNDDPISPSVKTIMKGKKNPEKIVGDVMYNPMIEYFKKGIGTLAYRDAWSLFDQMIMSAGFLKGKTDGYFFHKAKIYNKKYLVQKTGQYKGYPFRTFAGGEYQGGYSDHFPVYSIFLKEVKSTKK